MNVFTIITIVITAVCLTWSLGLYIFYRVKKSKVEKKAHDDLLRSKTDVKKGQETSNKD